MNRKETEIRATLEELLARGYIPVAFINVLVSEKNINSSKKSENTFYQSNHYLQDIVPLKTSSLPISKMFSHEEIYESLSQL